MNGEMCWSRLRLEEGCSATDDDYYDDERQETNLLQLITNHRMYRSILGFKQEGGYLLVTWHQEVSYNESQTT
jgi:hypothetical protein